MKIDEKELLNLLATKNQLGFDLLYKNYAPALFGVIKRFFSENDVSEDVLQEVFVKIWQNFDSYDASKGRFFTWMLNLTRNYSIDKLRSANYKYHHANISLQKDEIQNFDKNHSNEFNVNTIGVTKFLEELNPEYKLLIEYFYFKGYTQQEISDEFKIPLGTVKTRIRAALNELRNKLK